MFKLLLSLVHSILLSSLGLTSPLFYQRFLDQFVGILYSIFSKFNIKRFPYFTAMLPYFQQKLFTQSTQKKSIPFKRIMSGKRVKSA